MTAHVEAFKQGMVIRSCRIRVQVEGFDSGQIFYLRSVHNTHSDSSWPARLETSLTHTQIRPMLREYGPQTKAGRVSEGLGGSSSGGD